MFVQEPAHDEIQNCKMQESEKFDRFFFSRPFRLQVLSGKFLSDLEII